MRRHYGNGIQKSLDLMTKPVILLMLCVYHADLLKEVSELLAPFLGAAGLPTPAFSAAQRWGSALYPGLCHGREGEREPGVVLTVPSEGFAACGDFAAGSRLPGVVVNACATEHAVAAEMLQSPSDSAP